jgi:hypothetical protein
MEFQVGDEVKIINDDGYSVTTDGSVGTITHILGSGMVAITFSLITSQYQSYVGDSFDIETENLELLVPIPLQDRVINKVRLMHARQVKRGILHA